MRLTRAVWAVLMTTLVTLVVPVLAACGAVQAPALDVMQRDSLLGIGKILIVSNPSETKVEEISFRFENPNGDVKSYALGDLGPGEEVEVGWKKLDGFEVSEDAEIEIRAKGYGRALQLSLDSSI